MVLRRRRYIADAALDIRRRPATAFAVGQTQYGAAVEDPRRQRGTGRRVYEIRRGRNGRPVLRSGIHWTGADERGAGVSGFLPQGNGDCGAARGEMTDRPAPRLTRSGAR